MHSLFDGQLRMFFHGTTGDSVGEIMKNGFLDPDELRAVRW